MTLDLIFTTSEWISGWFRSNAKEISQKRRLEDDAEQSRKKRLSVAVNEVESALSRLREVAATASISPRMALAPSAIEQPNENTIAQNSKPKPDPFISDSEEEMAVLRDRVEDVLKEESVKPNVMFLN